MYCRNCGNQLPEDAKYCMACGTEQSGSGGKKGGSSGGKNVTSFVLGIVACAAVILACTSILGGGKTEEPKEAKETTAAAVQREETRPTVVPETTAAVQIPENGWYEENGKRYYYSDGLVLTGMQEIDDDLYYFDADGSLAMNTDVEVNGITLEAGSDGRVRGVTFESIPGEWSSEKYHFGNNGTSSIMELDMEVENCDRMTFYIEANGMHGASVNGNWKLYVRSHGSWVLVKEVSYSEPSQSISVRFDSPMDFDAITAYPTVQGNASYSAYYALFDVHMGIY